MKLGMYLYGLAAIATGITNIVWGAYASRRAQPVATFARWVFGLSSIDFGVTHLMRAYAGAAGAD